MLIKVKIWKKGFRVLILFVWSSVCLFKITETWVCLQTEKKRTNREGKAEELGKNSTEGHLRWQGPENLLRADTWAHISLTLVQGCRSVRRPKLSWPSPDAFPRTSFMFSGVQAQPQAPHPAPTSSSPTAFLGLLHRMWVCDRDTGSSTERRGREMGVARGQRWEEGRIYTAPTAAWNLCRALRCAIHLFV